MRLPDGFITMSRGRLRILARAEAADDLVRAGVLDHADPRRWTGMGAAIPGGRGSIRRMQIGGAPTSVLVVKPLLRGGALRFLNRDLYFTAARLFEEARLAALIRGRGLPASDMIFGRAERVAGPLVRLHLGTAAVEGAIPLLDYLRDGAGAADEVEAAVSAAGACVLALHDAGIHHDDLNLGNLLLSQVGGGAPRVTVIDLDGARILREMTLGGRARNLARLLRHAVKNGLYRRGDLGALGRAFLDGYSRDRVRIEELVLKLYRRTLPWHRLAWRLQGIRSNARESK